MDDTTKVQDSVDVAAAEEIVVSETACEIAVEISNAESNPTESAIKLDHQPEIVQAEQQVVEAVAAQIEESRAIAEAAAGESSGEVVAKVEGEKVAAAPVLETASPLVANAENEVVQAENASNEVEKIPAEQEPVQLDHLPQILEALIFTHAEPLEAKRMAAISGVSVKEIESALENLKQKYASEAFGFELVVVAEKYQFRSKSSFSNYVRELKAQAPRRLSAAALETLAIVAYRQPIVKSDIEQIRGVDATPTIKTLLERQIIKIVGHQASVGQPALYGTTDEFLKLFGLGSLAELPTLRDLKELEAEPGESAEDDVRQNLKGAKASEATSAPAA